MKSRCSASDQTRGTSEPYGGWHPFLSLVALSSLFDAIRVLLENHVHRLPIVDPVSNNVVFILTHKRILRFFYLYVSELVRERDGFCT